MLEQTMTDHTLSLAALHAAAPGVLDVVFGPDGDFEGAPRFLGPVWDPLLGMGRRGAFYMGWRASRGGAAHVR